MKNLRPGVCVVNPFLVEEKLLTAKAKVVSEARKKKKKKKS